MKKSTVLLLLLAMVACSIEGYSFPEFTKSKTEKFKLSTADAHIIFFAEAAAPFQFNLAISHPQVKFAAEKAVKTELKALNYKLDAPAKFNYYLKAFAKEIEQNEKPPYRSCNY